MNSKALLVLAMFLASTLLISSKVAPKDLDEKFDKNYDDIETSGVDENKYGSPWRGGYGSWRSGYYRPPRGHCRRGCCAWSHGRCIRCCFHPEEYLEANIDAEPYN